jgi:hypothetical protein
MAVDGDTLAIGAPYDGNTLTGVVYIYRRQGGSWLLEQRLPPPIALPVFGFFGDSVAVSGDTLIVGVGNESGGPSQSYIFTRATDGWHLQQTLPTAGQVAIDGDTAIVGDYGASYGEGASTRGEAGTAFIYFRSNGVWMLQSQIYASDPQRAGYFGTTVAIRGNSAVVGAIGDLSTGDESGSAYVFVRTGTNWSQTQKLRASDPQQAADFGRRLALSDNVLVIGAPGYVDPNAPGSYTNSGAAYVFSRTGGQWIQEQKLGFSHPEAKDGFGYSVACSEREILVGQLKTDNFSYDTIPSGSVTVFQKLDGVWTEQGKLAPNAGTTGDLFGGSVVMDGKTVVVGDPDFFGSAYVYEGLVLSRLERNAGGLNISFVAVPSTSYEVESAHLLTAPVQWESVTNVLGDGSLVNVPITTNADQRFYRVRIQ